MWHCMEHNSRHFRNSDCKKQEKKLQQKGKCAVLENIFTDTPTEGIVISWQWGRPKHLKNVSSVFEFFWVVGVRVRGGGLGKKCLLWEGGTIWIFSGTIKCFVGIDAHQQWELHK